MRTIDINTAHNINISYELSSIGSRIGAGALDVIIITVYSWIVTMILAASSTYGNEGSLQLMILIVMLPVYFYSFLCEMLFNGQTVGKMASGIKVVKEDGDPPTVSNLFIRWAFRFIDIWAPATIYMYLISENLNIYRSAIFSPFYIMVAFLLIGSVGILFVLSNKKHQRLGDIMAKTIVIRKKSVNTVSLGTLVKLHQNYEPTYSGVVSYTDEDMLLLKNTLNRYSNNKTDANKEALLTMYQSICERLNIEPNHKKKLVFLKTILNDYISLTR